MVTILARSRWTSTAARGTPFTWSRVRGIVCHYPAMGKSVGVLSAADEAARLRGWRNYHVGKLRWVDIGYNYAIGQSGRVYSLRGDRVGAHCVGHNSTTVGVLFIVGDNEPLTDEARKSFRALRATLRKRGAGSGLWGHTEMSGNRTRCPGPYIMADIRSGALASAPIAGAPAGSTSVPKPSTPPSTATKRPVAGKGVAAPAFPLPRKPGRLFYYGLASGGKTSVSGRQRNTAVPGDVVRDSRGRWYSKGLKAWQAQMRRRGYSITVDGRFGAQTERILRHFQKLVGEKVDGKLGPASYAKAWTEPVR